MWQPHDPSPQRGPAELISPFLLAHPKKSGRMIEMQKMQTAFRDMQQKLDGELNKTASNSMSHMRPERLALSKDTDLPKASSQSRDRPRQRPKSAPPPPPPSETDKSFGSDAVLAHLKARLRAQREDGEELRKRLTAAERQCAVQGKTLIQRSARQNQMRKRIALLESREAKLMIENRTLKLQSEDCKRRLRDQVRETRRVRSSQLEKQQRLRALETRMQRASRGADKQLASTAMQLEGLREQLRETRGRAKANDAQISLATERNRRHEHAQHHHQHDKRRLEERRDEDKHEAQTKILALEEERHRAAHSYKTLRRTLESTKDMLQKSEIDNTQNLQTITRLSSRVAALEEEIRLLNDEQHLATKENETLATSLQKAQAQLPALQQESERLSAILVSLRTKLDVERDRGRGLEAEVDCLRRQDVQRLVELQMHKNFLRQSQEEKLAADTCNQRQQKTIRRLNDDKERMSQHLKRNETKILKLREQSGENYRTNVNVGAINHAANQILRRAKDREEQLVNTVQELQSHLQTLVNKSAPGDRVS